MGLKVLSAKWRPFCLGLNVLKHGNPAMKSTFSHMNCHRVVSSWKDQWNNLPELKHRVYDNSPVVLIKQGWQAWNWCLLKHANFIPINSQIRAPWSLPQIVLKSYAAVTKTKPIYIHLCIIYIHLYSFMNRTVSFSSNMSILSTRSVSLTCNDWKCKYIFVLSEKFYAEWLNMYPLSFECSWDLSQ